MDIALVRRELAVAAATAVSSPKLTGLSYVPDAIPAPCIYSDDIEIEFDQTFGRGMDRLTVTMRLLCSRADDRAGQKLLDGYLAGSGPASIKAALESARGEPGESALNGACDDFRVERVAGYRYYEHGNTKYIGAEFTIRVIGPGG